MALDAYLSFEGKIKGSVTQKGREGKIRVFGVDHIIEAAADSASGFPGKTVLPGALVVTKGLDQASPALHKALQENTSFETVKLEMTRMPPGGGQEENHYTVVMSGVQVKSVRLLMRFNKPQDAAQLPEVEEVALAYKGIGFSYKGADGTGSSGPFMRDQFDDHDDALQSAIQDGLKGAAKDLGSSIATGLKDIIKTEAEKGAAGAAGG